MATKRKKRIGLFPRIVLILFIIYAVYMIISIQIQIREASSEVDVLMEELEREQGKNAELQQQLEDATNPSEETIVSEAQKHGKAMPDERVFVDVSGN